MSPKKGSTSHSNLLALGSAVVIAVYSAGYARTRSAAQLYADEANVRRPERPTPRVAGEPTPAAPVSIAPPQSTKPAAVTPPPAVAPKKGKSAPIESLTVAPPPVAHDDSGAKPTVAPVVAAPAVPAPVAPTATAPVVPVVPPKVDSVKVDSTVVAYKDGYYRGYGTSRHGDIEAEVEVKNGRIVYAAISQCLTRYPCTWITALPPQVLARQSYKVDWVSGATDSSDAFFYAVRDALAKAK